MNEPKNDAPSTAVETPSEKRTWQTRAMEVFDVSTSTLAGGGGPNPGDFSTYLS